MGVSCLYTPGAYGALACVESYGDGQGNCVQVGDNYLLTYHEGLSAKGPLQELLFCEEALCLGEAVGFPLCDAPPATCRSSVCTSNCPWGLLPCVQSYDPSENCTPTEDGFLLTYHEDGSNHSLSYCDLETCQNELIYFPQC